MTHKSFIQILKASSNFLYIDADFVRGAKRGEAGCVYNIWWLLPIVKSRQDAVLNHLYSTVL